MAKTKKHQQQKKNDQGGGNQQKKSKTIATANTNTDTNGNRNGNGNVWRAEEEYEIDLLDSRKTATGEIEGCVQWKDANCTAVGKTEWVSWDNLNEIAQAQAAAWEKGKDEDEARKMRAERRRKLQQRKELEEAGEGPGNGGAKTTDAAAADGTSGTSISAPKLAEKSTNAYTDADKGKRGDAGRNPEAKRKKVVQKEDDGEEDEDEELAAMPYDVKIVVQCKEAKSRQTLTLPSDSTIGLVKRDYIKARGHALSLELFDSLVFFYNGYPVTDGLVIGVISTPGVNLELHIRF